MKFHHILISLSSYSNKYHLHSVPVSMFKNFCYDDQLAVYSKALASLIYTCQNYELVALSDKFQKFLLGLKL